MTWDRFRSRFSLRYRLQENLESSNRTFGIWGDENKEFDRRIKYTAVFVRCFRALQILQPDTLGTDDVLPKKKVEVGFLVRSRDDEWQ